MAGLKPDAVVVVATVRALKLHGGAAKTELNNENLVALEKGLPNLLRHVSNIKNVYKLPCVVAVNRFPTDTDNEIDFIIDKCKELGVNTVLSTVWADGGKGGEALAHEVVRLCDISLNSEVAVLKALNEAAAKQNKIHKVIIMADVGDLREGFWDKDEMVEAAVFVENELKNLDLAGVGFNVGCWGSIEPMPDNLNELVDIAERIEARIGRQLEYISGGATSTLMRVIDGNVPERINLLRCGEGIILARDLDIFYGYDMSYMHQDVYKLYAEVIEVRDKPTHPVGKIAIDCFGHKPVYEDRGIRRRALLAMGRVDYGSIDEIFPVEKGVSLVGAASDHTIMDVEDAERRLEVGDIVEFNINYASLVYLSASRNVNKEFIGE
jgi:predicted amino acid racemase